MGNGVPSLVTLNVRTSKRGPLRYVMGTNDPHGDLKLLRKREKILSSGKNKQTKCTFYEEPQKLRDINDHYLRISDLKDRDTVDGRVTYLQI